MTYAPVHGSDPYRAIEYLRKLPLGTQFSSAALATAIGASLSGFCGRMDRAQTSGALIAQKNSAGSLLWSLSVDWWHGRQRVDPLTIEARACGGVLLRRGRAEIVLGADEVQRLAGVAA